MRQYSLLPYLHAADRYVEDFLGRRDEDLVRVARAVVSYDLALLACGCRPRISMHCAALTAAELLCLAARLERAGAGPAYEVQWTAQPPLMRDFEHDAAVFCRMDRPLTQLDIALALGHFRHAAADRGVDLITSLSLQLQGVHVPARTAQAEALAA